MAVNVISKIIIVCLAVIIFFFLVEILLIRGVDYYYKGS